MENKFGWWRKSNAISWVDSKSSPLIFMPHSSQHWKEYHRSPEKDSVIAKILSHSNFEELCKFASRLNSEDNNCQVDQCIQWRKYPVWTLFQVWGGVNRAFTISWRLIKWHERYCIEKWSSHHAVRIRNDNNPRDNHIWIWRSIQQFHRSVLHSHESDAWEEAVRGRMSRLYSWST